MSGPSSQDEEKWDDCDCDVSNYCCYWVSGSDPVRGSWSISRVYTDSDTAASWPLVTTLMTQDTHIPCSQTGVTPLMILTWDPFNDPVMIPYHLKWPPFNTQTLLSLTFKSNLSFHALSKRWATPWYLVLSLKPGSQKKTSHWIQHYQGYFQKAYFVGL